MPQHRVGDRPFHGHHPKLTVTCAIVPVGASSIRTRQQDQVHEFTLVQILFRAFMRHSTRSPIIQLNRVGPISSPASTSVTSAMRRCTLDNVLVLIFVRHLSCLFVRRCALREIVCIALTSWRAFQPHISTDGEDKMLQTFHADRSVIKISAVGSTNFQPIEFQAAT